MLFFIFAKNVSAYFLTAFSRLLLAFQKEIHHNLHLPDNNVFIVSKFDNGHFAGSAEGLNDEIRPGLGQDNANNVSVKTKNYIQADSR